jgi:hypothetical protein
MRTGIALASVVLFSGSAAAERSTTIVLGGLIGGVEQQDVETTAMEPAGGARLVLSFEHPQPTRPEMHHDVTVVPELVAAAVLGADRGEALVGVGARGEVRLSLGDHGWRTAFYAAGRALIVGSDTDPAGEVALGEYIYIGKSRLRFGGEGSLLLRKTDQLMGGSQRGILVTAYLGWSM